MNSRCARVRPPPGRIQEAAVGKPFGDKAKPIREPAQLLQRRSCYAERERSADGWRCRRPVLQFERLGRIGSFVVIAGFAIGATAWTLEMSRRSVAFAFWINWALMGLAFVTWLVAPARFGRSYYRVHAFERSGRLYERLGVRHFQRFLRRVGFMNPWLRYRAGPSAGATLVAATEASETAHMVIFIMLALVSGIFVRRGWWIRRAGFSCSTSCTTPIPFCRCGPCVRAPTGALHLLPRTANLLSPSCRRCRHDGGCPTSRCSRRAGHGPDSFA